MKLTLQTKHRVAAPVAIACAAMLWPVSAIAASAAPAGARAVAPACETPGLVMWLDTNGSGAAGSTAYKLHFTNLSGHRCTLNGFPFVLGIGLSGHQLGRRASFDRSRPPHVVSIAAGATATAILTIKEVGDFTASACRPVTAAGLRVFPPNQTRAKTIPFPFGACSRRGPVYMTVGGVGR
jgi:hypothetical protein